MIVTVQIVLNAKSANLMVKNEKISAVISPRARQKGHFGDADSSDSIS